MCGRVQVAVRRCEKKTLDVWESSQRLGGQHERLGREDLQVGNDERRQEVSRRPSSRDEHTDRSQHVRAPTCCPVQIEPAISRCFGRETGYKLQLAADHRDASAHHPRRPGSFSTSTRCCRGCSRPARRMFSRRMCMGCCAQPDAAIGLPRAICGRTVRA